MKISFNTIRSMFDDTWDIGYLSAENLYRVALTPVKQKNQFNGFDYTNNIHFNGLVNTLVFIKKGSSWDYTHYEECVKILNENKVENYFEIFTNYKEAAVISGLGVRARNSLVYSYAFGFDCHICAIGFTDEIIDYPTNTRINHKLWSRCKGCLDCVNACPVGAIRGKEEPYWLHSISCDNFIGMGKHDRIPSIYTYWRKHVYTSDKYTEDEAIQIAQDRNLPWDINGYSFDGNIVKKDDVAVDVPICRECTSQPRCSKWNGDYPYYDVEKQKQEKPIRFYSRRK